MEIVVTQQNGWSKPVNIVKSIIRIGSAATNDIQLESPSVAPLHLQIFHSQEIPSSYRVLNLAGAVKMRSGGSSVELVPLMTMEIKDRDEIELGEYHLLVRIPITSGVVRSSRVIDASVVFSEAVLRPHVPAVGILTIKNNGDKDASQFQVMLRGLVADCFQMDPIPLMYPGAQEEIRIRLFHKITYPKAGNLSLSFVISAPESYPGEELLLQQMIYVEPVLNQIMELKDDVAPALRGQPEPGVVVIGESSYNHTTITVNNQSIVGKLQPDPNEILLPGQVAAKAPQQVQIQPQVIDAVPDHSNQSQQGLDGAPQPAGKPAAIPLTVVTQAKNLSKIKIVHGPSDEFWDE